MRVTFTILLCIINIIAMCSQTVNFTATSQGDLVIKFYDASDFSGSSWFWEFGDGTTSVEKNPIHTYSSIGDYNICLTVDSQRVCKENVFTVTEHGVKIVYDDTIWPNGDTSNISSPFGSRVISSTYDFHRGLDIDGDSGDPMYALADGEVYLAYNIGESNGVYSSTVVILKHEMDTPMYFHGLLISTYYSHYFHMNSIDSSIIVGQSINKGDIIGEVGMTGATYNHNHFEIRVGVQCSIESQKEGGCSSSNPFSSPTDPHVNPMLFLENNISDTNSLTYAIKNTNPLSVEVVSNRKEVDFNEIIVTSNSTTKTVNFNTREGINPTDIDNDTFNDIQIIPSAYTSYGNQKYIITFVFNSLTSYDKIIVNDIWNNQGTFSSVLNVEKVDNKNVVIFPNPVMNTITLSKDSFKNYILFNYIGQVKKGEVVNNSIDIERLPQGVYFLKITTDDNRFFSTKIIKVDF